MIKSLLLALSLLHPHHKHQQEIDQQKQVIAAMTHKAAGHVLAIRMATTAIRENCPYIPDSYFETMQRDLNKIALDKDVSAPSFRQDFDDLEDDFHSLLFAITVYDKLANT